MRSELKQLTASLISQRPEELKKPVLTSRKRFGGLKKKRQLKQHKSGRGAAPEPDKGGEIGRGRGTVHSIEEGGG